MNMITAFCEHCGYQLKLPASVIGKTGKCPSCGQPTIIDPSRKPQTPTNVPQNRQWTPSQPSSQAHAPTPPAPPAPVSTYAQAQWTNPQPSSHVNPYNAPQAPGVNLTVNVGANRGGQFTKRELSQLDSCANGISMIYWGMNTVAGCLIGYILLTIFAETARPSLDTIRMLGIVAVVLAIGILIACLVQIVGHGILMSAPERSGAKGLLITAFVCAIAQPICSFWFNLVAADQIASRNFEGAGGIFIVAGLLSLGLSISAFISHFTGLGRLFDFSINYGSRPRSIMWACLIWLAILVFGAMIVAGISRSPAIAMIWVITVVVLPLGIIISYVRMLGTAARYIRDLVLRS